MIKDLLAALRFLSILPAGKQHGFTGHRMVPYFPLVGLLLGVFVALMDTLLCRVFSVPVASLIDVVFLAVITGGLHLDGLADTADGIFSHKTPEEALHIMKDSRVGTMGILALIFVLAIKWAGISSIQGHRSLCLIIIPAYARAAFTVTIYFLDYIRPEGGTGAAFFGTKKGISGLAYIVIPIGISVLIGPRAILLNCAFIAVVGLVVLYYKKRFGGVTGDMLGALGEVTETVLFLSLGIGGVSFF
ncbi:MAG: adenosylcobinamide-GDP ribazoletransferase [Deltaproteobacteria bacterium]|nr:adenosylcobinamide-GDP ribazoletransferase [Deltaproteobacteria bacterium]MBW2602065.1 adenosylcobinamide-GDP ribazoletransferase [Deltaproteobacteria bacterium]